MTWDWNSVWGWVLAALALLGFFLFAGCSQQKADALDMYLRTLNDNGVVYNGSLEGPTTGGFRMYTGGEVYTGGWIRIELQGPASNPMAGGGGTDDVEGPPSP